MEVDLYHGNCLNEMKKISDNSVDSIVTDPPYGISFLGKEWDHSVPSKEVWKECFRVLKPGGHLLAFAGTRTQHRMAVNIEDTGFEIRDMIAWVYGSGFPKSMNISKAIDKAAGVEREVVGKREHPTLKDKQKIVRQSQNQYHRSNASNTIKDEWDITEPATEDAKKWDGWGTSLKPALEPITVARKPLSEKTIVANVLKHGTGGLNIDGCRIEYSESNPPIPQLAQNKRDVNSKKTMFDGQSFNKSSTKATIGGNLSGRFPANFIHDGSDEVTELFPLTNKQAVSKTDNKSGWQSSYVGGELSKPKERVLNLDDQNGGSAARFFYCAKASGKERNEGLTNTINTHPTIKPISLMRYLVKLVTPKNGTVLDPFMGSGTTGKSALQEGMNFIGIELDDKYFQVAKERIEYEQNKPSLEKFFD